jgi:hypothetical protein
VAPKQPWRVPLLGWGNQVVGVLIPIGAVSNIVTGLRVYSFDWAWDSVLVAALLGLGLGYLHWSSGRAVLRGRPWAFQRTCMAGGMMIGFTAAGMLILAAQRLDHSLLVFIRHGSDHWWDWSFDHFQNSALREMPVLAWEVCALGTVVRHRLPGAPAFIRERLGLAVALSFCYVVMGGIARHLQLGTGALLSSQR